VKKHEKESFSGTQFTARMAAFIIQCRKFTGPQYALGPAKHIAHGLVVR